MKLFINTKTKQYPLHTAPAELVISPGHIKRVHAKVSTKLAAAKPTSPRLKEHPRAEPIYAVVHLTTKPTVDYTKNVVEGAPEETAGVWNQVWNVVDATAEEIAARTLVEATKIKTERDAKLTASDWTQLADSPVDKALWATYRQALRDLTAEAGFPWTPVVWPAVPGEVAPMVAKLEAAVPEMKTYKYGAVDPIANPNAKIRVVKTPSRMQKTA
jgi:hypothetical protein